jgi:hypothetical protein
VTTSFTYHPTRRWLMRILTTDASGTVIMDQAYTRDGEAEMQPIQ